MPTSYYASLSGQWASAESIRNKYRRLRNRSNSRNRSKSNLHAATIYIKHLNIGLKRHSAYSKHLRTKHPTDHTLDTSINLISNLQVINLPIFLRSLMDAFQAKMFMKATERIHKLNENLFGRNKFSQLRRSVSNYLTTSQSIYSAENLLKKFANFNLHNSILVLTTMLSFELFDLYFVFLRNFHLFSMIYLFVFTSPSSIVYYMNHRYQQMNQTYNQQVNKCSHILSGQVRRNKSVGDKKRNRNANIDRHYEQIKNGLISANRIVSLSLLCLVDFVLIRNNFRLNSQVKVDDQLDLVYLVEYLVENLVNYDEPTFDYLPEEEHLSADRLKIINYLTIFCTIRLAYNLIRLQCVRNVFGSCDIRTIGQFKNLKITRDTPSNEIKNKSKDESTDQIEFINTFIHKFQFTIISIQPIALGLLTYNVLYIDHLFSISFGALLISTFFHLFYFNKLYK